MGMRIVWEVRSNDIPRIVAGMEEAAIAVVTATLFDIEASAKGKVAVDTGNLRNSITTYPQGLSGEVATGVDYAAHQEYGTHKMPAHPYLTPAAEEAYPAFLEGMTRICDG